MAKKIITVSRQFGSGGRTIAKELAKRLDYDYYDKEIIESVAEKTGFSEQFIAEKGERSPGKTIFSYGFDTGSMMPGVMYGMSANDYIWTEQSKFIRQIADSGKPCVIVGRSADYTNVIVLKADTWDILRMSLQIWKQAERSRKRLNSASERNTISSSFPDSQRRARLTSS